MSKNRLLWFQVESLGLSLYHITRGMVHCTLTGVGSSGSISPMISTSLLPISSSVKRGNQDISKHPPLNCSAEPPRTQQNRPQCRQGEFSPSWTTPPEHPSAPRQPPRMCTAPALHFNIHFSLRKTEQCHPESLNWLAFSLLWRGWFGCQDYFPCPFVTILSHPITSKFFLSFQRGFHEVLSLQDFVIDIGMIVEVQAPKSYSTAVKNDALHTTSIINRGSLWTSASECIQSCQASILFWNRNLLGSFAFLFLKAKYFKMKPVALLPLQNQTNKWNFSTGKSYKPKQ